MEKMICVKTWSTFALHFFNGVDFKVWISGNHHMLETEARLLSVSHQWQLMTLSTFVSSSWLCEPVSSEWQNLGISCPSWQWHRTGYSWLLVQILLGAPLWCDLRFCFQKVVVIKLLCQWNSASQEICFLAVSGFDLKSWLTTRSLRQNNLYIV